MKTDTKHVNSKSDDDGPELLGDVKLEMSSRDGVNAVAETAVVTGPNARAVDR